MLTRWLLVGGLVAAASAAQAQQVPAASGLPVVGPMPAAAPAPHLPQGKHMAFNRYAAGPLAPGPAAPAVAPLPTGQQAQAGRLVAPAVSILADVLANTLLPYNYATYHLYQAPVLAPAPTAFQLGTQP